MRLNKKGIRYTIDYKAMLALYIIQKKAAAKPQLFIKRDRSPKVLNLRGSA